MKVGSSVAHTQHKPGATYQDKNEYEESFIWTHMVIEFLKGTGIDTYRVPVGQRLAKKVSAINSQRCDLAIEIHFNACGGGGASGCETLYYPGSTKGRVAAAVMQGYVYEAMHTRDRGAKEGWYKMDRPGVIDFYGDTDGDEMPDYFLRKTNCTALILEPEFLEQWQGIEDHRGAGCEAISLAIQELLSDKS